MPGQQTPATILIVDDEEAIRALLRDCFELDGYRVVEARDGAELARRLAEGTVDLITLDLNLNSENGFDLARQIRATHNIPIIMITGKGDPIDRIVGLELGADDYIAKPFHLREVLARVHAVLRRYAPVSPAAGGPAQSPAGPRFEFDGWMLDVDKRELKSTSGEARDLTTAEFNLLVLFLERPSRVLSRDNIMDLLKGHEWSPLDRSIDSLIVRLRRKIEREPEVPRLIKTVRGVGYAFSADVRRV
jgi:DNA-binding response OmpR family regulator